MGTDNARDKAVVQLMGAVDEAITQGDMPVGHAVLVIDAILEAVRSDRSSDRGEVEGLRKAMNDYAVSCDVLAEGMTVWLSELEGRPWEVQRHGLNLGLSRIRESVAAKLKLADSMASAVRAALNHPSLDSEQERAARDKLWAYIDAREGAKAPHDDDKQLRDALGEIASLAADTAVSFGGSPDEQMAAIFNACRDALDGKLVCADEYRTRR